MFPMLFASLKIYVETHNPLYEHYRLTRATLKRPTRVLNLTEKNRDLLFDTVAPRVKTVCSFIRDNTVRTAEG